MKEFYKKLSLYVVLAVALTTSVEIHARNVTKENLIQNTIKTQTLAKS